MMTRRDRGGSVLPFRLSGASLFWGLLSLAALAPATLLAAQGGGELDTWRMGMDLLGGLALFLFGMELMTEGLSSAAGDRMRAIMARLTVNRYAGVATGAATTAVIQSSSVTTVLVVGFVSAGIISLPQAIGIIFGAEIGTTVTAQIIAFKVTKYALPAIALGFLLAHAGPREVHRLIGRTIMGFGIVFFGMTVMSHAMKPLSTYQPFMDFLGGIENPVVGTLVAAGFTALIQSSSATTGIVIVMASQGFVTLPIGIALIFGANIGTCITALLAAIGRPREAVRAALVHVLFNVLGVTLWLGLIDQLGQLVVWLSPVHAELDGMARLAAETPRQIANAHTAFNIMNTLIFLPFVGWFARFVVWLVPERRHGVRVDASPEPLPSFLDPALLDRPVQALDVVRQEIGKRMGTRVQRMLKEVLPAVLDEDRNALAVLKEMDHEVDLAYAGIVEYLGRLSDRPLPEETGREVTALMSVANQLEHIGDIIETNLVHLGRQRIRHRVTVSPETRHLIIRVHEQAARSLAECLRSVTDRDLGAAQGIIDRKPAIQKLLDKAERHQARRLTTPGSGRMPAYSVEMDVFDKLSRIYYHTKRVAKAMTPYAVPSPGAAGLETGERAV